VTAKYSSDKETNRVVSALIREGWHVKTGKHPRVVAPDGRFTLFSYSPSDGNASRNLEREVRKIKSTTKEHTQC